MLRPDSALALVATLPSVPVTPDTGADAMLRAIRGYTTEEVLSAAATAGLSDRQSTCLVLALAARFSAKAARRAGKESAA